jgi:hypothetical protein
MSTKEVNEVWRWPSLSGTPTGSVELMSEHSLDACFDELSSQVSRPDVEWHKVVGVPWYIWQNMKQPQRDILIDTYSKPMGAYGDSAQVRCGRCAGCKATKAGLVTKCANQYQSVITNHMPAQVSDVKTCPQCNSEWTLMPSAWHPNELYCRMCSWKDPNFFAKKPAAKPSASTAAKSQPSKVCIITNCRQCACFMECRCDEPDDCERICHACTLKGY